MVKPFIINITMEINFSSKVYSKSLLKGLHDITCSWLLCHGILSILSRSMEADMFDKRIGTYGNVL